VLLQIPFTTLFSFFIFLALMLYTIRFRNAPGASYFIVLMLLNALLALSSAAELLSSGMAMKLMWRNIEQIPLFAIPLSFYGMVLIMTGVDRQKVRRQLGWISLPNIVYLLLIFTDSSHHLMRSQMTLEPFGYLTRIQLQSTGFSLFFIAFARIIGLLATLRLLYCFRTVSRYNRIQYGLILISSIIPYIITLLAQLLNVEVSISVSNVPGGLLLCLAVFQYKLLRVRPLAKDTIIEHMKEGVVVADTHGIILDMNPSAIKALERLGGPAYARKHLGKSIWACFEHQPRLLEHYEHAVAQEVRELQLDAAPFHYSVSIIPVGPRSRRTGTLFIFTDISERIAYETELLRRANIDGLTQVYNRQCLLETTSEYMSRNQPLSFMLIDIDYFKAINDQYGHQAGDRALTKVAAILRETVGGLGIVGRMGGEEFAVSLPGIELAEALMLAEVIRGNVEQNVIEDAASGKLLQCTVSIGVSWMSPDGSTFTETYQKADDSLYQSKHKGRNRVTAI